MYYYEVILKPVDWSTKYLEAYMPAFKYIYERINILDVKFFIYVSDDLNDFQSKMLMNVLRAFSYFSTRQPTPEPMPLPELTNKNMRHYVEITRELRGEFQVHNDKVQAYYASL